MWACYKGRTDAASVLLRSGANPNVKGEVRSRSYLCFFLLTTWPMKRVVKVEVLEGPQRVACNLRSELTKDKKMFKICFLEILVDNFALPFWVFCHIKANSVFHPYRIDN